MGNVFACSLQNFLEKILIESCLEAAISGKIDGMQDLGAAGLTSAAVECALNGSSGIEIDVGKIPRRDAGMEPYEVMLSETQERMLISVSVDRLKEVKDIFDNWDIIVNFRHTNSMLWREINY